MKYLLLAFVLLVASCKDSAPVKPSHNVTRQVKAVYNECNHKWAIQTGIDKYGPVKDTFTFNNIYFGGPFFSVHAGPPIGGPVAGDWVWMDEKELPDTLDVSLAGSEFQFAAKDSALLAYARWTRNPDTLQRKKQIADSIWKCNHTYN